MTSIISNQQQVAEIEYVEEFNDEPNRLLVVDVDDLTNPIANDINNLLRSTSFTKTCKGIHYYFN